MEDDLKIISFMYRHNSSAALLSDGKVIGCVAEEKFDRIKNTRSFPINSINYLSTVVIATFSHWKNGRRTSLTGQLWPLLRFFKNRASVITIIDNPTADSNPLSSNMEIFENGKPMKIRKLPFIFEVILKKIYRNRKINSTPWILKLRDLIAAPYFMISEWKKYDLFIGVDAINALSGIMMRSIGLAKAVVYYETDYNPERYANKLINKVYVILDSFCAKHADYAWNISASMIEARKSIGYNPEELAPQITVNCGVFPEQIEFLPYEELAKNTLIFSGTFTYDNGLMTLLDAMPDIVSKVPSIKLIITGADDKKLNEIIVRFDLSRNIEFKGFIEDHKELEKIIRKGYIGIAPFKDYPGSVKRYGDVSKLRLYTACGLPVISTKVTASAKEIEKYQAGIVIDDNKEQLVEAILKLLSDEEFYKKIRENAIKLIKNNIWDDIFFRAFKQMGYEIKKKSGG